MNVKGSVLVLVYFYMEFLSDIWDILIYVIFNMQRFFFTYCG